MLRAVLRWAALQPLWRAAAKPPTCDAASGACAASYPRVVIGCWQLLERVNDRDQAVATLRAYGDEGFRVFDTADIYGPSESILGAFRQTIDYPVEFYTKYVTQDGSLRNAQQINKRSRKALGVESLDMVQFHWWDFSDRRYIDAAKHLVTLQGDGRIRDVAACNFDTAHLRDLVDAGVPIAANQVQYSVLDRRPENGMIAYAKEKGIRLAIFGTVAGGWLSDRYLGAKGPPRSLDTVSMQMYKTSLDQWSGGDWALFQVRSEVNNSQ